MMEWLWYIAFGSFVLLSIIGFYIAIVEGIKIMKEMLK